MGLAEALQAIAHGVGSYKNLSLACGSTLHEPGSIEGLYAFGLNL